MQIWILQILSCTQLWILIKVWKEHLKQIEMIAGDKKPIKWLATQKIELVASFTLLPQNKKVENLANVFSLTLSPDVSLRYTFVAEEAFLVSFDSPLLNLLNK